MAEVSLAGTALIGPKVANAVCATTGQRLRKPRLRLTIAIAGMAQEAAGAASSDADLDVRA